ncbi:MAG: hypothetical protein CM15mV29_0120 [uncultured marine virus]|nr:MAG: hypothetical protein CM15mV29_0120 [uncultured marine virus]
MIRWWGRNSRFLDEPKDSPAWTAAQLWGGRAGKSWAAKLKRAIDAEERAAQSMSTIENVEKITRLMKSAYREE